MLRVAHIGLILIYCFRKVMKRVESRKILIVEDDEALRERLRIYFAVKNDVTVAKNLEEARRALEEKTFNVIVLDLVLPDGSGLSLFESENCSAPVVILTDLGSDESIISGLGSGAADYIVKPVSESVLEARMALRLLPENEALLTAHGMTLNLAARTARFKGITIELTSSEFNILAFLMQNAGNVFSALDIYEKVWKMPHLNTQTIRIHLHNMRKKLMLVSPECGSLVMTEFGKGYFFKGGTYGEN